MADKFKLEVPLSASEVEDFEPDQKVKVGVRDRQGNIQSTVLELDANGAGTAKFGFEEKPAGLRVAVGPGDAGDDELFGLRTLNVEVPSEAFADERFKLQPVLITTYYWRWWRRWCRTVTITGEVICPDGKPVPGAKVCAYDVDFWWWWASYQPVGCATTNDDGFFSLTFRWCCGFWPWWWWRWRTWQLEPVLADHILPTLQRDRTLRELPVPTPRLDLGMFDRLLQDREVPFEPVRRLPELRPGILERVGSVGGLDLGRTVSLERIERLEPPQPLQPLQPLQPVEPLDPIEGPRFNPTVLDRLREPLLRRLPRIPELEPLRPWPWWPWQPWFDCNPDLVFRVTQDCEDMGTVIVNESLWDVHRDLQDGDHVELKANEEACCVADEPDPPGPCIVLSNVCHFPVEHIGGNLGAPATPLGYANPGGGKRNSDRPFAEGLRISGTFGTLAAVAYYEFEWFDPSDPVTPWKEMPAGSVGGFHRRFYGPWVVGTSDPLSPFHRVPFPVQTIDGHRVIESRQHFEATHAPGTWGPGHPRLWMVDNYRLLMRWFTKNHFPDGVHRLRLVGWDESGGVLSNRRVLPLCNTQQDNGLVVRIDNRFVGGASGHPTAPDHPCGGGTVHTCTTEPDTDFLGVRISGQNVSACANVQAGAGPVEIDFLAHDPEGHLSYYTLFATYGENLAINLLGLLNHPDPARRATLVRIDGPPPNVVGPTYEDAQNQAAPAVIAPVWNGGTFRLTIPQVADAFPETCCYQLELRAHKRTVVNCSDHLWGHVNYSEYSFMVVV